MKLDFPSASFISAGNSSSLNLSAGNSYTFTGEWELTHHPDVMVNLFSDKICNLKLQFSFDGVTVHSTLTKNTEANINEFTTSVKGARFFRVLVTSDSLTTTTFIVQSQYGIFRAGNAPQNLALSLDSDAITVRPSSFQDEVRIGRRLGVEGFTKFAYRSGLTAAAGEQIIWTHSDNGFTPMTAAETYTITYNSENDGAGTTGALSLAITHVNASGSPETFLHTLGDDGSDITTQTGTGINRVAVASSGSENFNVSPITITATTATTTQAHISAENSVTQQAIFHTGFNHQAVAKWLYIDVAKLTGGGDVRALIHGYIFNKAVQTRYLVFRSIVDTRSNNIIDITDPVGFKFSPSDVIYFTADTDTNASEVDLRLSLNEYQQT